MNLVVSTPTRVVLARTGVRSVRASDATGAFGIQPGHAPFLTALTVGVVTWRDDARVGYVAVSGGILRVSDGRSVEIATREAIAGDDLRALERDVLLEMRQRHREERTARRAQLHLEIGLLRRMFDHLTPPGGGFR